MSGSIAVNHLAPFVLTGRAGLGAARRRAVAGGELWARPPPTAATIDLDDLEGERRWWALRAYGQSKLAIMMATFERARAAGPARGWT
ncbi:MAG: hypothetical protein WDN49_20435 [Acetobacteraceae bacterium]